MTVVVVINYRQPTATLECLRAVATTAEFGHMLILVDNAPSASQEQRELLDYVASAPGITYLPSPTNLGFAGGVNLAVEHVRQSLSDYRAIVLLNNDTIPVAGWLRAMVAAHESGADMVAAALLSTDEPGEIDSIGIVLYRCGIAANRRCAEEALVGPCGGAALYSRQLVEDMVGRFGTLMSSSFFCYAEDTELAVTARLLGYRCAMADSARIRHVGALSSGGGKADFVMLNGLRNSLRLMHRSLPMSFLLRNVHWVLLAQAAILLKYVRLGRTRLLFQVYREFIAAWSEDRRRRRLLRRSGLLSMRLLREGVSRRFYESRYLKEQFFALFSKQR